MLEITALCASPWKPHHRSLYIKKLRRMDQKNPIYFLEWFDLSDVTIVENKCYSKL